MSFVKRGRMLAHDGFTSSTDPVTLACCLLAHLVSNVPNVYRRYKNSIGTADGTVMVTT